MLAKINALDRAIVNFFQGLAQRSPIFYKVAEFLAAWPVYLIPVSLVVYWFWAPRWRVVEIRAVIAGLFAWQIVNRILQFIFDRSRPLLESSVSDLLFKRPTDSFPSNHAAFGMAIFLVLYLAGERGLSWLVLTLTLVFSLFRVITGLHFPSDIVVGWLVGLASGFVAYFLRAPIDQYISRPLINLAKWLKLA